MGESTLGSNENEAVGGARPGKTAEILEEQPFLRRLALRLARRPEFAEDLVQETMFRAWRARASFETGTSMRAWLATILRRLFLTETYKNNRRRTDTNTDLGEPLAFLTGERRRYGPETGPEAYEGALEHVDDRVRRAFVRLPDTYRAPFVLFALDGLSYAEIAGRLSVPIGTVMSRIHRARERLRASALQKTTGEIRIKG